MSGAPGTGGAALPDKMILPHNRIQRLRAQTIGQRARSLAAVVVVHIEQGIGHD